MLETSLREWLAPFDLPAATGQADPHARPVTTQSQGFQHAGNKLQVASLDSTLSKKQKAAIHGVVPTTTAQPPAATTTPATTPAASTPTVNLVVTTQQAPAAAPAPAVVQVAPASTGGATATTPKS